MSSLIMMPTMKNKAMNFVTKVAVVLLSLTLMCRV